MLPSSYSGIDRSIGAGKSQECWRTGQEFCASKTKRHRLPGQIDLHDKMPYSTKRPCQKLRWTGRARYKQVACTGSLEWEIVALCAHRQHRVTTCACNTWHRQCLFFNSGDWVNTVGGRLHGAYTRIFCEQITVFKFLLGMVHMLGSFWSSTCSFAIEA